VLPQRKIKNEGRVRVGSLAVVQEQVEGAVRRRRIEHPGAGPKAVLVVDKLNPPLGKSCHGMLGSSRPASGSFSSMHVHEDRKRCFVVLVYFCLGVIFVCGRVPRDAVLFSHNTILFIPPFVRGIKWRIRTVCIGHFENASDHLSDE
jgi:hypothetical protein